MNSPLVEELASPPSVEVALAALIDERDVVLFESTLLRTRLGRYSFLSADPVRTHSVERAQFGVDPFEAAREWSSQFKAETVPGLPPFQGGIAGMLAYELGGCWERLPQAECDELRTPVAFYGLYDWVLAWDHLDGRAWIISHGFPETDVARRAERARQRIEFVKGKLSPTDPVSVVKCLIATESLAASGRPEARNESPAAAGSNKAFHHRHRVGGDEFDLPSERGVSSNFTRENYLAAVARVIEYIRAGDIFQANLSQRLSAQWPGSGLDLYRQLRRLNPAPFAGYLAHDDWAIVSASPERFVRVVGDVVETRPIKGTRQRRATPEADLFTRDELRASEKDVAENVMIVDLLRNDLSRVCEPGSISVPQLCVAETYETVQHLVSEIRGTLTRNEPATDGPATSKSAADVWTLLAAVFPGGSITGAPKIRAMEIIAELESTTRGPYCGSLFYVGSDGTLDSNILIRTFVLRDGVVRFNVGGGVVAQSDPVAEYEETLHKAEGMLRVLRVRQP